jgi:hypothetical protein
VNQLAALLLPAAMLMASVYLWRYWWLRSWKTTLILLA